MLKFTLPFYLLILLSANILQAQEKPNILFIFADDQTFESLGSVNNAEVKTPNLDRLAEQGILFTHAFNQGAWTPAVCVSSRLMLNTGSFLWKAARYNTNAEKVLKKYSYGEKSVKIENKKPQTYWSLLMKDAGYETYMSGKWHVNTPAEKIFDHTVHIRPGMPKQSKARYQRKFIAGETDIWTPYDTSFGGYWQGGKHWSEVLGDDAVTFLKEAGQKDKPFFMYLAFNAPHDPRQSPKRFVDMYPLEKISIPKSFMPEYPYNEAAASGRKLRDERLAPFPRTEYSVKVNRQEYYAIISHMNEQIGRILDALEKSGKRDNTYIFFTADHGLALGDHGFIGKQNLYDRSIRVPLIIVGPDVPKNRQNDELVYLQDIMPTTLQLASIEKPAQVDFHSLLPLAKSETQSSAYPAVYGAYLNRQRMVRTKDYKMIIYPSITKARLYNIKNDLNELNDLADNPAYKNIMKKLFQKLFKLQEETGDQQDLTKIYQKYIH